MACDLDRVEVRTNSTGTAKKVRAFALAGLAAPGCLSDTVRRDRRPAGGAGEPRGTGMNDPIDRRAEPASDSGTQAEVAALRERVGRLERQLAQLVKTFSERLTEHGRRLDALDRPEERRPGHEGG